MLPLDQRQIPFSFPTEFDNMEMAESAVKPILIDNKEDDEKSSPTTPVSERPTDPTRLMRIRSFQRRKFFCWKCLQKIASISITVYVF